MGLKDVAPKRTFLQEQHHIIQSSDHDDIFDYVA